MKNVSTPGECVDELLLFDWFLPCPSPHSSSCVLSGWFWRWQRSPLPAVAEPSDLAAEGWRRSLALAGGSGSSCRSLWKSRRSPALTDSQLIPVGPHMILGWRVTSWSLGREMCLGWGWRLVCLVIWGAEVSCQSSRSIYTYVTVAEQHSIRKGSGCQTLTAHSSLATSEMLMCLCVL